MNRLLLALVLLGLTACPNPKPPTPTPPPVVDGRPVSAIGTQLERVNNGKFTIPLTGAIACWPPDDANGKPPASFLADGKQIPYLWPSFSKEWADLVKSKGYNGVLVRIGPSYDKDVCCGLPSGEQSQPYWDVTHEAMRAATKNDQIILVSVGWDGWQWKHQLLGDPVQLAAPIGEVAAGPVVPAGPALQKHVKDIVYQTCNYTNVIYEISNESSLIPGWTSAWERYMQGLIREAEQQQGCDGIVHLIGSNTDDVDGPYDFLIYHDPGVQPVAMNGKAIMINEYNPHITPATLRGKVDEFKGQGHSFWYWRSDGDLETLNQSLDALTATNLYFCPEPVPDRDALVIAINCDALYGGSCDATPTVAKSCAYCRDIGMGEYNGTPRCSCPIRNEGDPNRINCEQYILQAPAPLWYSDGSIEYVDANHFRVRSTGTYVEACDSSGKHCTRKDLR